ncbi:hypothetical protein [Burkholderia sp. BCC0405]|nr:hypothetical protein [Burkholderia sp. BCC0405]
MMNSNSNPPTDVTTHAMENSTLGAYRLIARYGKATDFSGTIDRSTQ